MPQTPYEWYNKQMVDKLKRERMTATEWFAEQIEQHLLTFGNISLKVLSILKKEAKSIEKEHIAKAWDAGNHQYFCSKITNEDFDNGEEYYEENYKK